MSLSNPAVYGASIAGILKSYASQPLPLTRSGECRNEEARALRQIAPASLLPNARNADAAVSGLLLLLGCWEESHQLAQDVSGPEGSYWHAIVHRMEPDSSNSAYWFRLVGQHAIFPELRRNASQILDRAGEMNWRLKAAWDPFLFIEWCDEARRQPGGRKERAAREIQQVEWQLLFEWCAAANGDSEKERGS